MPSPAAAVSGPRGPAPAEAISPRAVATESAAQDATVPGAAAEVPVTTKQRCVGLAAAVTTALQLVLDRKQDGDALVSGEITPLVQELYEGQHGWRPERGDVQVVLAGKLKGLEREGQIRLAGQHKGIGGFKTWAVVKLQELASTPEPPSADPAKPDEPGSPEQRPETAAVAPLPDDVRPEPEQRLAAPEATHEQEQIAIAALRQRIAELEEELRLARRETRLAQFFAHVREGGMRVVIEPA